MVWFSNRQRQTLGCLRYWYVVAYVKVYGDGVAFAAVVDLKIGSEQHPTTSIISAQCIPVITEQTLQSRGITLSPDQMIVIPTVIKKVSKEDYDSIIIHSK